MVIISLPSSCVTHRDATASETPNPPARAYTGTNGSLMVQFSVPRGKGEETFVIELPKDILETLLMDLAETTPGLSLMFSRCTGKAVELDRIVLDDVTKIAEITRDTLMAPWNASKQWLKNELARRMIAEK